VASVIRPEATDKRPCLGGIVYGDNVRPICPHSNAHMCAGIGPDGPLARRAISRSRTGDRCDWPA